MGLEARGGGWLARLAGRMSVAWALALILTLVSVTIPAPQATAKPTFSFGLPGGFSLAQFVGARSEGGIQRRSAIVKPYTGLRMSNSSLIMIYWYDQTVAVAELGPEKLLLSCELIEVKSVLIFHALDTV